VPENPRRLPQDRRAAQSAHRRPLGATSATPRAEQHLPRLERGDVGLVDPAADLAFILNALTCSQWGGRSDSGYCNKAYDNLYARQAADTNRASRISMIRIMQADIFNARLYIVLCYDAWTEGRGLDRLRPQPDGSFSQMSVQTMLQPRRT